MHLLVPFASDLSEACRHVLRDLSLPNLGKLLARLAPTARDSGSQTSYSPPHERAQGAAWGWRSGDGLLPFAARAARADGIDVGDLAWGLLTPSHWELGRDHVTMTDPSRLSLDEPESRALFETFRPLLEGDGFRAAWGAADRWYAGRADLAGLATASLDRVIGRSVDPWLRASASEGSKPSAEALHRLRQVRRLQSEAQLVFHVHPVNEAREERGAAVVNSFWLSGCGAEQAAHEDRSPTVELSLRKPLLEVDWAAWADAWRALDLGAIAGLLKLAEAGTAVALTLCGERTAARFESRPRSLWQRMADSWQRVESHGILEGL